MCWAVLSHSVVSNSLRPHGVYPAGLLCPWEFSKQENWSELPFPSPGDLPDQVIEPRFPALQADSLQSELQGNMYTKIFFVMAFDMKGKIK